MNRWSDYFKRVKNRRPDSVCFYVCGSRRYHYDEFGYGGEHEATDLLIQACERENFPKKENSNSSPINAASHEITYAFLDGGLALYSGNYFYGTPRQGTYVDGFKAMRWALEKLKCPQPRRLKGEAET